MRSSTAPESLALVLGFDGAFVIRHDIKTMLSQHIPILTLTDSHQLFTTMTRAKLTTERRLMTGIEAVREAYHERTIANIAFNISADNYADGMTKRAPNTSLLHLLQTHGVTHGIPQYIIERK